MLSLFIVLLLNFPFDEERPKGPMMPLEKEKLQQPISLKDKCDKIKIIEWQVSDRASVQNQLSIDTISSVCNLTVDRFFVFTKQTKKINPLISLSLLPKDNSYRHLNDSASRFYYRTASYNDGQIIPILGYYQRATSYIYIFNQVLVKNQDKWESNIDFKKILAHEIYHSLSYQTGLFDKRVGNKEEKEEAAAQKFVSSYTW